MSGGVWVNHEDIYQLPNMACLQSVKRGTKAHVSTIVYRQYARLLNLVSSEKQ